MIQPRTLHFSIGSEGASVSSVAGDAPQAQLQRNLMTPAAAPSEESDSPSRERLLQKVTELNAIIDRLTPMRALDPVLATLLDDKIEERNQRQMEARMARPLRTRLKASLDQLTRVRRRRVRLVEEEASLAEVLRQKQEELLQATEQIDSLQSEFEDLQTRLQQEAAADAAASRVQVQPQAQANMEGRVQAPPTLRVSTPGSGESVEITNAQWARLQQLIEAPGAPEEPRGSDDPDWDEGISAELMKRMSNFGQNGHPRSFANDMAVDSANVPLPGTPIGDPEDELGPPAPFLRRRARADPYGATPSSASASSHRVTPSPDARTRAAEGRRAQFKATSSPAVRAAAARSQSASSQASGRAERILEARSSAESGIDKKDI